VLAAAARGTVYGIVFAGFINLLRPLVTCLLGLVVYHWIEKMGQAESLLPDRQDQVFPFALKTFARQDCGRDLAGLYSRAMTCERRLAAWGMDGSAQDLLSL